jgi:hypothetical protein
MSDNIRLFTDSKNININQMIILMIIINLVKKHQINHKPSW